MYVLSEDRASLKTNIWNLKKSFMRFLNENKTTTTVRIGHHYFCSLSEVVLSNFVTLFFFPIANTCKIEIFIFHSPPSPPPPSILIISWNTITTRLSDEKPKKKQTDRKIQDGRNTKIVAHFLLYHGSCNNERKHRHRKTL